MEITNAVSKLTALAHDGRLSLFRALVRAGDNGMAAGEIARTLGVPSNTLSAQLAQLTAAGLASSRRAGRSIIYAADYAGMSDLLVYLMEDCCQGSPAVCSPMSEAAARTAACCTPMQGA